MFQIQEMKGRYLERQNDFFKGEIPLEPEEINKKDGKLFQISKEENPYNDYPILLSWEETV